MTDRPVPDQTKPTAGVAPFQDWEFPEIAVIVVLAAVAVLVLGGLATGIARSVETKGQTPFDSFETTWVPIEFGAQWADPFLASLLLGLLGVCWWQFSAWRQALDDDAGDDDVSDVLRHTERGRKMVIWIQIALIVTAAGAIAGLVGSVMTNRNVGGAPQWSQDIYASAVTLAVLLVASAGLLLGRQLNNRYTPDSLSEVSDRTS